jgi:hypothetical protein
MPNNVQAANPTDVMPRLLCVAFNEQLRYESLVNQDYADGSSDRAPLVTVERSFFRINSRVGADWKALRDFYIAHVGQAFYFYFLRETVPPYSYDATGAATIGRYIVVFDSGLSETYGPGAVRTDTTTNPTHAVGRAQIAFQLREVE